MLTNEPPFPWHVENARHAKWKQKNARPAFAVPGNFYPDERFLRINLLKDGMPAPGTHTEAVQQVVHVLNSVTVPPGAQLGTDSSAGEGAGDHTMFAVVYDFANLTVYWRTEQNQNLQRLRLRDAQLGAGSARGSLPFAKNELPWYHDAAGSIVR